MHVAVFNGPGRPITIEDFADDPVGPGEARIEISHCGICGSDITMTSGSAFDYVVGCRLGHETSGTVIETGKSVSSLKVGNRVAVLPRGFCGACPPCRQGRPLFCESGPVHFGGFGRLFKFFQLDQGQITFSFFCQNHGILKLSVGQHRIFGLGTT